MEQQHILSFLSWVQAYIKTLKCSSVLKHTCPGGFGSQRWRPDQLHPSQQHVKLFPHDQVHEYSYTAEIDDCEKDQMFTPPLIFMFLRDPFLDWIAAEGYSIPPGSMFTTLKQLQHRNWLILQQSQLN